MKTQINKHSPVIQGFTYHRNGVGGHGFYAFVATIHYELRDGTFEDPQTYLVTWFGFEDEKENWDHLSDTKYAFVPIDHFGPHTERTMRGDNLIYEIKGPLKAILKAKSAPGDYIYTHGWKDGKVTKG